MITCIRIYIVRFLFFIFSIGLASVYADIFYKIKHASNGITVQAQFDDYHNDTIEELYIPGRIWGANYNHQIKNIKVTRSRFYSIDSATLDPGSQAKQIHNNYNIEYDIINLPYDELVNTFGDRYYHFFDKDRFFLFGLGLFVMPKSFLSQHNKKVTIILDSTAKQIASTISPYYGNTIETNIGSLDNIIIVGNKRLNQLQDKNLNINIIAPSPNPKFFRKIRAL